MKPADRAPGCRWLKPKALCIWPGVESLYSTLGNSGSGCAGCTTSAGSGRGSSAFLPFFDAAFAAAGGGSEVDSLLSPCVGLNFAG